MTRDTRSIVQIVHGGVILLAVVLSTIGLILVARGHHGAGLTVLVLAGVLAAAAFKLTFVDARLGFYGAEFGKGDDPLGGHYSSAIFPTSSFQAALFAESLLFPTSVTSRIKENVSPLTRALRFETRYTLCLPPCSTNGKLYLPVLLARKGVLFDDLSFTNQAGEHVPTLAYSDYVNLVRSVLRKLVKLSGRKAFLDYTREDADSCSLESRLMSAIASRAPQSQDTAVDVGRLLGQLEKITKDTGALACGIANNLIHQYAIVVELPASKSRSSIWHQITTTERRILPLDNPRLSRAWPAPWLLDRVRKLFGVRPNRFKVPVEKAKLAASYHLEFMGPEGSYLGRQYLEGYGDGAPSYARLRPRLGQRYSHLYVRGGSSLEEGRAITLILSYFERPPGSLGSASVSAFACAAIIAIGASLAGTTQEQLRGDLIALLFAFPGVGAVWVGLDRPTGPFGGTLAARMSALVTFLLALTAAAVYLDTLKAPHWSPDLNLWRASDLWAGLLIVGLVNAFWVTYAWVRRSLIYGAVLARRDPSLAVGGEPT